ncbi:hypothetical protein SAMN05421863_11353 [Nitrosomonas communis]|jgi:hypothetical protein|uniref:Uncharacterized protein n=1 Tax=Nitrosomonas communis TaxID=44574 RepID=A0A1I4X5X0_9PROT|nr:hypothetical protein SAMN05421863_11353 [Nitrosomonas communis]
MFNQKSTITSTRKLEKEKMSCNALTGKPEEHTGEMNEISKSHPR